MQLKHGMNLKHFTLLALALTVLVVTSTDIYIASLPALVVYFKTTPNLVNLTLSVYTLSTALFVLFIGVMSNRFGRKKMLIIGLLIFLISSFVIALANSIWLVIFFRAGQAYGSASLLLTCRLIIKDTMNLQEQIHTAGILIMGVVFAPVAPSIGALLAKCFGWQGGFLFSGFCACFSLIAVLCIIKETNSTPITMLGSFSSYLQEYWTLLFERRCVYLVLIIALTFAVHFVFIGISSYLFINKVGMSPLHYSYLFMLLALGYLIGNIFMMWLNRQNMPPLQLISLGVLVSVLGLFILGLSLTFSYGIYLTILVMLGVLIMRLAAGFIIVPAEIELMYHFGQQSAQVLGLATCLQFVLASVVITLAGLFHAQPKYGLVIIMTICFVPVIFLNFKLKRLS